MSALYVVMTQPKQHFIGFYTVTQYKVKILCMSYFGPEAKSIVRTFQA